MKHPLHFTVGCMGIAFVGAIALPLWQLPITSAQTSASISAIIADDQDTTAFQILSEKEKYTGTNIKDAYRNAYTVFTSTDTLKAIWTLRVASNTSYCVSVSLPKNQLFLPKQDYKVYDGKDGSKLLATISANQDLPITTAGCAQGRGVSAINWIDTGITVKSTTGFIRVEYTSGVSAAVKSYIVLDAIELRPISGSSPCGNGKIDVGEECDTAAPNIGLCSNLCHFCPPAACPPPADKPGCYWTPGGEKNSQGCPIGCGTLVCGKTCGNSKVDAGEGCDDGNGFSGDGCSATCSIEKGWQCSTNSGGGVGGSYGGSTGGNYIMPTGEKSVCTKVPGSGLQADNDTPQFDISGESKLLEGQNGAVNRSFRVAQRTWFPPAKAVWNFPDITSGKVYEVHISVPPYQGSAQSVVYHVYDGKTEIGTFNLSDSNGGGASGGSGGGGIITTETWRIMKKTFSFKSTVANIYLSAGEQADRGWLALDAIKLVPSGNPSVGFCGDGWISGTEQCDDNNVVSGDGCSSDCRKESGVCLTPVCALPPKGCQYVQDTTKDSNGCYVHPCGRLDCGVAVCGNKIVEASEQCDDGNKINGDGCGMNCNKESCGNGILQLNEACDDGNMVNGDGCDKWCAKEICGNAVLQPATEECDDGNKLNGDGCSSLCKVEQKKMCTSSANCTSSQYCSTEEGDCTSNCPAGAVCAAVCYGYCKSTFMNQCGNGKLDGTEQCDDGNRVSGDGCGMNCNKESCGNGILQLNEACDDGNMVNGDGCDKWCAKEICGNAVLQPATEECDDGNKLNGDGCSSLCKNETDFKLCLSNSQCGPQQYCSYEQGCKSSCKPWETCSDVCYGVCSTKSTTPLCGNGKVEGPEHCDDANKLNGDGCNSVCKIESGWQCSTSNGGTEGGSYGGGMQGGGSMGGGQVAGGSVGGYYPMEYTQSGRSYCTRVITINSCGDGMLNYLEECDDSNTRAGDGCSVQCKIEAGWSCGKNSEGGPTVTTKCYKCGDGKIEGSEQCDDGNVKSNDGCSATCEIEVRDCTPPKLTGAKYQNPAHGADVNGDGVVNENDSIFMTKVMNWQNPTSFTLPVGSYTTPPVYLNVNGSRNADGQEDVTQTDLLAIIYYANYCQNTKPTCGNGKIEGSEQCDDGNTRNGDGCSAQCEKEAKDCSAPRLTGAKYQNPSHPADVNGDGSVNNADAEFLSKVMETQNSQSFVLPVSTYATPPIYLNVNGSKNENGVENVSIEDLLQVIFYASNCQITPTVCGNGKIENGEMCDDGNTRGGDGCSSNCDTEFGSCNNNSLCDATESCTCRDCFGKQSTCSQGYICDANTKMCALPRPICGNGKMETGEQCDDGNSRSGDGCTDTCSLESSGAMCQGDDQCPSHEYCTTRDGVCLSNCMPGQICGQVCYGKCKAKPITIIQCGNSKIEGLEQCDDGNVKSGDGCSSVCKKENPICAMPMCAAPPPGCKYMPDTTKNSFGCLQNPCGKLSCETGEAILQSDRGTGQYDQMTYSLYESEISLTPATNMNVSTVVPDVYYCNGVCTFEFTVKRGTQTIANGVGSILRENSNIRSHDLQLPQPFTLTAGETYTVSLIVKSTKSIGIFTAGGVSPNIRSNRTFTINYARSNSADHRDRGPVGFSFYGTAESVTPATGSFRQHTFTCYDGYTATEGGPTSCKPASLWMTYAEQACATHCSRTTGKCGVNSWQVVGADCSTQQVSPSEKAKKFVDTNQDGQFSNIEISAAIRRMSADMRLSGSTSASLASDFDGNGRVDVSDFEYLADLIDMTPKY